MQAGASQLRLLLNIATTMNGSFLISERTLNKERFSNLEVDKAVVI
jgi:hypothetical protein